MAMLLFIADAEAGTGGGGSTSKDFAIRSKSIHIEGRTLRQRAYPVSVSSGPP